METVQNWIHHGSPFDSFSMRFMRQSDRAWNHILSTMHYYFFITYSIRNRVIELKKSKVLTYRNPCLNKITSKQVFDFGYCWNRWKCIASKIYLIYCSKLCKVSIFASIPNTFISVSQIPSKRNDSWFQNFIVAWEKIVRSNMKSIIINWHRSSNWNRWVWTVWKSPPIHTPHTQEKREKTQIQEIVYKNRIRCSFNEFMRIDIFIFYMLYCVPGGQNAMKTAIIHAKRICIYSLLL